MENSKKITNFSKEKETDKAILVKAIFPELKEEKTFWLPKSKISINGKELFIDEEVYKSKLDEVQKPIEEKKVIIHSKQYDKEEKATKLILEASFNDNDVELWVFIPNSKIEFVESKNDEYFVTVPEWVYKNAVKSSLEHQLEFYNKNENIYSADDFTIKSKVEHL